MSNNSLKNLTNEIPERKYEQHDIYFVEPCTHALALTAFYKCQILADFWFLHKQHWRPLNFESFEKQNEPNDMAEIKMFKK